MKYTDLTDRITSLDDKLTRNLRELDTNTSLIRRLETQLESARSKSRKLSSARVSLTDQRDTARRELNARLG